MSIFHFVNTNIVLLILILRTSVRDTSGNERGFEKRQSDFFRKMLNLGAFIVKIVYIERTVPPIRNPV